MTMLLTVRKNKVDDLASELDFLVTDERDRALDQVVDLAKQYVHVISGKTQASIRREGDAVVAEHGAVPEELGTVFRDPHPFMYPAFTEVIAELPDRIGQRIEEFVG